MQVLNVIITLFAVIPIIIIVLSFMSKFMHPASTVPDRRPPCRPPPLVFLVRCFVQVFFPRTRFYLSQCRARLHAGLINVIPVQSVKNSSHKFFLTFSPTWPNPREKCPARPCANSCVPYFLRYFAGKFYRISSGRVASCAALK